MVTRLWISAADFTGHFKFKHSSLKYTLLKKGHNSKHTLIYFIIYSKLLKTAISYFKLYTYKKPSATLLLEFYLERVGCQIGDDFTFGDYSDCCRWSLELNQTKTKYLKRFQIANFGLGLDGILLWKISFSSSSLRRQLLTYPGAVDGQGTSIKWSSSYFLQLAVLPPQLLHYYLP